MAWAGVGMLIHLHLLANRCLAVSFCLKYEHAHAIVFLFQYVLGFSYTYSDYQCVRKEQSRRYWWYSKGTPLGVSTQLQSNPRSLSKILADAAGRFNRTTDNDDQETACEEMEEAG